MSQYRHLLHEVKDELDWAAREVRSAEQALEQLSSEYNARMVDSQDRGVLLAEHQARVSDLRIAELYRLLHGASRRFALLTRIYEIGATYNEDQAIRDAICATLFRSNDDLANSGVMTKTLNQLSQALYAYFHVQFSDESDEGVRSAWLETENSLRRLGRKI